MRYATISLILTTAAAVVPSLALPLQAREDPGIDLYAREFEDELFARAGGAAGKKGGPRQIGSLPHKPPKWETRDLEGELFARILESGPPYGPSRPRRHRKSRVVRREDIDNLWERTDMNELEGELFARILESGPPYGPSRPRRHRKSRAVRREDIDNLWERTDMNELEGELFARTEQIDPSWRPRPRKHKYVQREDLSERTDMNEPEGEPFARRWDNRPYPKKKKPLVRKDLWERMDMDELE